MTKREVTLHCEDDFMKLMGGTIRVVEKTATGITPPPECWVRGCSCPAEYCCDLEMKHPEVPEGKLELVLLCSDHTDATAAGKIHWDWYRIGKRIVFVPFGYERRGKKEK